MANAKQQAENDKKAILNALGEGGNMTAAQVVGATKLTVAAGIKPLMRELMESGDVVQDGKYVALSEEAQADWDAVHKPKAASKATAKVPAKTAAAAVPAGKIPRKAAVPVVEEPDEEPEATDDEIIAEYEELATLPKPNKAQSARLAEVIEIMEERELFEPEADEADEAASNDELVDEYNELLAVGKHNKTQAFRFAELEAILEERGLFENPAEADDTDDTDDTAADDTTEEHDFFDDEDEPEVPAEPARAGNKGKQAAAQSEAGFSMPFKPIDTLTDDELAIRIELSEEMAEALNADGQTEVAEMLCRIIAKARKQQNKRG